MSFSINYIVKSDMDDIKAPEQWAEFEQELNFRELIGQAVVDTLVSGDGAFKISADSELCGYPIVEFISGDRVDIEQKRGIVEAITFKTQYYVKSIRYELHERYSKGRIDSVLYDSNGSTRPLSTVPALAGFEPEVTFPGDFIMAVPLCFYVDKKYRGRGKSIFSGGKSQCFDALDEVISQWIDAIRAGRVTKYIPETLIPRDPKNGSLLSVDNFGAEVVMLRGGFDEKTDRVDVSQPDIKYDAFVSTYTNALLICLQGIISPATLGIDVGRMSSAEAQREKKDITGNTRNTITAALEIQLPKLIEALLKTYDIINGSEPQTYNDISVSFGEYGAPDFDSRIETIGKAATYGIMSTESQVDELWGNSKKDDWKEAEVQRIKAEKGIMSASEPSVGGEP